MCGCISWKNNQPGGAGALLLSVGFYIIIFATILLFALAFVVAYGAFVLAAVAPVVPVVVAAILAVIAIVTSFLAPALGEDNIVVASRNTVIGKVVACCN